MPEAASQEMKGTCYAVMGFGKKTDFETGRTLDLDKTYRQIIKPAAEAAGLRCLRADDVVYTGLIDVPMYEQLLNADVVIADLSTSNKNAYYELGVRHALRPYTTIVIAEDKLNYPFDVNHIVIRRYRHMGEGLDFEEVMRFREVLTKAIVEILSKEPRPADSPVYTFLNGLTPPVLDEAEEIASEAAPVAGPAEASDGGLRSGILEEADEAQNSGDFMAARALLRRLRAKMRDAAPEKPEDPYIIQRLALVTYKGAESEARELRTRKTGQTPEDESAIQEIRRRGYEEARELLKTLNPETSNDTETLGLWGAVHKRLWELTGEREHVDEAVRSYERGFYLRNDYYNGINLAYLLNQRAADALNRAEAVADFVQARRVRREVVAICDELLGVENMSDEDRYWVLATKAEALLGAGDEEASERTLSEAYAAASAEWMKESTTEQMSKLRGLLADSPLRYVRQSFA